MSKTYVAINDPVHNLLRDITRLTPLVPYQGEDGSVGLEYSFRPERLPDAYYSLAALHALQGLSLQAVRASRCRIQPAARAALPELVAFFDVVRLDLRCCRDLRLKPRPEGPGLLAAELLAFGTGTLRAVNNDPGERIHRQLLSQYGRVHSRHEVVYAHIGALHRRSEPAPEEVGKECYDSSNLIYGDALGEVEQLWERRADTAFLDQVAASLRRLRHQGGIACFCHPPLAVEAVVKMHFRAQAVWKSPPASGRALLRRIEYILQHTTLDSATETVYRWRTEGAAAASELDSDREAEDHFDRSGYDGWLPGADGVS
jgi:hypothetical protein